MKLSKETLDILGSTTQINDGIVIQPGNVIQAESEAADVFVRAEIVETFPTKVVFSRTAGFIQTLKLFDDPDIEFKEDHCVISSGSNSCRYYYGHDSLIANGHWHNIPDESIALTFNLSKDTIKTIQKATNVLDLNQIEFTNNDGKILCNILDRDSNSTTNSSEFNSTANNNSYSITLGDCDPSSDFKIVLRQDIFNVYPGDYTFKIAKMKFVVVCAENNDTPIAYQIAANRASFFNN